jgi:hypothetical protein
MTGIADGIAILRGNGVGTGWASADGGIGVRSAPLAEGNGVSRAGSWVLDPDKSSALPGAAGNCGTLPLGFGKLDSGTAGTAELGDNLSSTTMRETRGARPLRS